MGVKVVCYWSTLFQLTKKQAETGDPEDVRKWREYQDLCLEADEMR